MFFSSPVFLFIFFPLFFAVYFLLPGSLRNGFILLAGLVFYVFGAGVLTLILMVLLLLNWISAKIIERLREKPSSGRSAATVFVAAIALNLAPLIFFKYLVFFAHVISDISGLPLATRFETWGIALPLGISFYTFRFLSYQADVYMRRIQAEPSLQKFAVYSLMFPPIIAGPVVRFAEVKPYLDVTHRRLVESDLFWGLVLFVIGLSKKILIADPLGAVVDTVHRPDFMLTTYSAWLAAWSYSFQIYFDFSGYTDMAIGLAQMMGFRFPRNFNRPYVARSVGEFWQRWHMTLSRWFRDYVYIPLGGNRATPFKTYRNLFVVFILCALWHGAAYTFLVWGIGHGALIALERAGILKTDKMRMGGLPVFLLITLLWVPFRAANLTQTGKFLLAMCGLDPQAPFWADANRALVDPKVMFLLILAAVICLTGDKLYSHLRGICLQRPRFVGLCCFVLYLLACISAVERGFNPFIYVQF